MSYPTDRQYTREHLWVRKESEDTVAVGMTPYAQDALGDVTHVELSLIRGLGIGQSLGVIESVKSANDIFSPVRGDVVEVNSAVVDHPGLVNSAPLDSWLVKIKLSRPPEDLLNADGYQALIDE